MNGVGLSLVCCHGAGSVGAAAQLRFAAQLANYPLTAALTRSHKTFLDFLDFFPHYATLSCITHKEGVLSV